MRLEELPTLSINGENLKIAVVLPYFNEKIGLELFENCKEELLNHGVLEQNITLTRTFGALETPFACQKIINTEKPDALITLGVIIRGDTTHYELVTETTFNHLMQIQLTTETPISFGILACENQEQAEHRSAKTGLNKGKEAALAALIQTQI